MRVDQIRRYARHVLLPHIGGAGQKRILEASVEVDDATGAGAAAVVYLAAAGVGTLVVRDRGTVSDRDLAEGVLYESDDVGHPRIDAVRAHLEALNPDVRVVADGAARHRLASKRAEDVIDALELGASEAARLLKTIARGGDA